MFSATAVLRRLIVILSRRGVLTAVVVGVLLLSSTEISSRSSHFIVTGQVNSNVKGDVPAQADTRADKLQAISTENAELLKKVADLESELQHLKAGIQNIVAQIKDETFNPTVVPKIAALLEAASTLSEKEFRQKYQEYVQESHDQNYAMGIDPYKDIHTFDKGQAWFVPAVKEMSDAGLFKGIRPGEFGPGQAANVAEVSVTFARALGLDGDNAEPVSALAQSMPDWARGAAGSLEQILTLEDTDLSQIFAGSEPQNDATRLQSVRLAAAAFDDVLPKADGAVLEKYVDLAGLSDADRTAISRIAAAGVMTGTNGNFNPNGAFSRAEFAAVMYRLSNVAGSTVKEEKTQGDANSRAPQTNTPSGHQAANSSSSGALASSSAQSSSSGALTSSSTQSSTSAALAHSSARSSSGALASSSRSSAVSMSPPEFSVVDITQASARITWKTTVPTTYSIQYGPSASPYQVSDGAEGDGSLTLDHTYSPAQHGSSLWPGTTYHFRVTIVDQSGNRTVSGDQTFQTLPAPAAPVNTTFSVSRLFPGQYENTKYNLTVSDPENVRQFSVQGARGTYFWGGDPPCLASLDSGTVDMEPADFPLTVTAVDCAGGSSTVTAQMPPLP